MLLPRRLAAPLIAIASLLLGAGGAFGVIGFSESAQTPSPARGLLPNGRQLTPQGAQVVLGNLPTGGAVTADGRFLWTVSAGFGSNDVRIVDTIRRRVIQVLPVPGASGGIALDSRHRLAYVSGVTNSRWQPSKKALPGAEGNVILVYQWSASSGLASPLPVIQVRPPPDAPTVQTFPPAPAGTRSSWPQKLAVSPDGTRLLVPLNLADNAAIIDLGHPDRVRYVPTGSYPFAAAILPGGRIGVVTNEAAGTLSIIDLESAAKLADIAGGPPLSHPQSVVIDRAGKTAYVAVSGEDQVVVVNLSERRVERTISVGRSAGLGTMPVALALGPLEGRLFVAESGADEISVIRLPSRGTRPSDNWKLIGRIPVADQPQAVVTVAAKGDRPAQLIWIAAKGLGVGPNLLGPNPLLASDPIYWAFQKDPPTVDVFEGVEYVPALVTGRAGLMKLPSDARIRELAPAASRQLRPVGARPAPANTFSEVTATPS